LIFGFAVLSLSNSEIGAPRILFTPYTIDIQILKLVHREIHHIAGKKFNFGIGAPQDTSHSREMFLISELVHRKIHHIAGKYFNFGIGAPRDT
jgi:hypothetical protein